MNENNSMHGNAVDPKKLIELHQKQINSLFWIKHIKFMVPYKREESGGGGMLAAMISPAGDRYLSAFTHPGELAQWPFDNNKTVLLSFDELKLEVLNNPKKLAGIVIDPFSKMLLLDQELIEQIDMLTEGFGIRRVEHSRDLQLTRPAKVMPALIEELSVFLSGKENVYSAYMLMAREPDDPQPRLLFIIDFDGEKSELFPDLTKLICPYINQDETFEMMKATYELLEAAALKSAPVYKKP